MSVLNSFADDYEDFDMIVNTVAAWAAEKNISFTRSEILESLKHTISLGLAEVYKLPSQKPMLIPTHELVDSLNDYHFYVTEKGKQLLIEKNRNVNEKNRNVNEHE